MELTDEEIPEKLFREFKKVGSNFLIQNRALSFTPRGAWRILAKSDFLAAAESRAKSRSEAIIAQNPKSRS